MAVGWGDLAELRRLGRRPGLPVYITDRWLLARNMTDVGCMAIVHRSGEPMPVHLLHGLDVRLDFDRCETAGKVKRLIDAKEITPASLYAWCRCARGFVATCGLCDKGDEPWSS